MGVGLLSKVSSCLNGCIRIQMSTSSDIGGMSQLSTNESKDDRIE